MSLFSLALAIRLGNRKKDGPVPLRLLNIADKLGLLISPRDDGVCYCYNDLYIYYLLNFLQVNIAQGIHASIAQAARHETNANYGNLKTDKVEKESDKEFVYSMTTMLG